MTEHTPLEPEGGRFPVFVDDSGRRHRWLRVVGWCIGALAASYIALFALSLVSSPSLLPLSIPGVGRLLPNAGAPEIGVPGQGRRHVATVVATSSPTPAAGSGGSSPSTVPAPTSATPAVQPSAHPTPTAKPTAVPSATPTPRPTAHSSPSTHPTPRGTGKPTARPTSSRGHSPTARPQQSPR